MAGGDAGGVLPPERCDSLFFFASAENNRRMEKRPTGQKNSSSEGRHRGRFLSRNGLALYSSREVSREQEKRFIGRSRRVLEIPTHQHLS